MEKLQNKIHTEQGRSVPLVRFPMFKDEWEHKELNELLSESKKKNADLKYSKEEVLSVSGELGIVNQIEHLGRSYAGASVHNYGVVELGDIVYTKSPLKANPYGIIKINKGKAGIVSTLYAVYKVNEKTTYGDFLDYYFSLDANTNRYLRPLVKKGAKNDMKINNEYVLHDRIFAPTIPEQKRIANFFSVLDNKINQLKEKEALLSAYKKGMMQKIFSQEIRFKDDDGKEFPDWEEKKLQNITKINQGLQIAISKRLTVKTENSFFYITNEFLRRDSKKEFYIKNPPKSVLCQENDILMTRTGNTGRVVTGVSGAFHNNFFKIKVDENKLNKDFLYYFLTYIKTQHLILNLAGNSTIPDLNHSDFYNLKIYLPNIIEQILIANFLSKIDAKIKTVNEQIEETATYKKGLLQKMFCV